MPSRLFAISPVLANGRPYNGQVMVNIDNLVYVYRDTDGNFVFLENKNSFTFNEYVVDAQAYTDFLQLLQTINNQIPDNALNSFALSEKDNVSLYGKNTVVNYLRIRKTHNIIPSGFHIEVKNNRIGSSLLFTV